MPFMTRAMLEYMRKEGLTSREDVSDIVEDDDEDTKSGTGSSSADETSKSQTAGSGAAEDGADEDGGGEDPKKEAKLREIPVNFESTSRAVSIMSDAGGSKASVISKSSKGGGGSKSRLKSTDRSGQNKKKTSASSSSRTKSSQKSSSSSRSRESIKSTDSRPKGKQRLVKPVELPGYSEFETKQMSFEKRKVLFIQSLIQSNVKTYRRIAASRPVEDAVDHFQQYTIDKSKPIGGAKLRKCRSMYEARHRDFNDIIIVAKVYDGLNPKRSPFLKILNHLGKKHPSIVQTWDIFSQGKSVYIFQEYAPYLDLAYFIAKQNKGVPLAEERVQQVARQLRKALDFLGDMGVCHLNIQPAHVLLMHATRELLIKLTGFSRAIIYYNARRHTIRYQRCIPFSDRHKSNSYRAPEIFGNPAEEKYDPIAADVWSYGCTLYNAATCKYPYDVSRDNANMENEIQHNVRSQKQLSREAQSVLGHCLTVFSNRRYSVDKLAKHPWLIEKSSESQSSH